MSARQSIQWNLLANWLAHAGGLIVGFFLMPYVLRTLGDHSYGTWLFLSSFASYAGLMYLGFGSTISRFISDYHARHDWTRLNQLVNVSLAIYSLMGLLICAIAVLLAVCVPWLKDWDGESLTQVRVVILLLGLNSALGMVGSVFGGVLHGIQRFDLERGIAMFGDLLRVGLTVLFLHQDWGLVTLAAIFLAITLYENISYVIVIRQRVPQLKISLQYVRWSILKECWGFSAFALIGTLANQLLYATDTILIGCLLVPQAIVPYYIALRLVDFLRKPILQIGDVCMPKAGQLNGLADLRSLQQLIDRGLLVAMFLAGGLFIGAWFFGDLLIVCWVGDKYLPSHQYLMILFGAQLIALPLAVTRSILFGMGHVRMPSLLSLLESVLHLVLAVLFLWLWGLQGLAWSTAVPIVCIELGLLWPYTLRTLQLSLGRLARNILLPLAVPMTVLTVFSATVDTHWPDLRGWLALLMVAISGGGLLLLSLAMQWFFLAPDRFHRLTRRFGLTARNPA